MSLLGGLVERSEVGGGWRFCGIVWIFRVRCFFTDLGVFRRVMVSL